MQAHFNAVHQHHVITPHIIVTAMLLPSANLQNQPISLHSFLPSQPHLIICANVPRKSTFQDKLHTNT